MELTFLGTACMMPTKERNHAGMLLIRGGEGLLFDCGEGIQRQLRFADIKPTRVSKILISHWHGDHCLGLPGLVQTIGASNPGQRIDIYGPEGSKEKAARMLEWFHNDRKLDIHVHEAHGKFFESDEYELHSLPLDHVVPTIGFRFEEKDRLRINVPFVRKIGIPDGPLLGKLQEGKSVEWKGKKISPKDATTVVKGRSLAYVTDTALTKNCYALAKDVDLLVSEATFAGELAEKAEEYKHLTVQDAAHLANQANVKKLVLTHLSQRYKDTTPLLEEARNLFAATDIAFDFMKLKI